MENFQIWPLEMKIIRTDLFKPAVTDFIFAFWGAVETKRTKQTPPFFIHMPNSLADGQFFKHPSIIKSQKLQFCLNKDKTCDRSALNLNTVELQRCPARPTDLVQTAKMFLRYGHQQSSRLHHRFLTENENTDAKIIFPLIIQSLIFHFHHHKMREHTSNRSQSIHRFSHILLTDLTSDTLTAKLPHICELS